MPPAGAPVSSHDIDGIVTRVFGLIPQTGTGRDELDDYLRSVVRDSDLRSQMDHIVSIRVIE